MKKGDRVMNIRVFGACCSKCTMMYGFAQEIIKEHGLDATLEKVTDVKVQMQYGIMSLPALMIDEKLISAGRVLSKKDMEKFICQK